MSAIKPTVLLLTCALFIAYSNFGYSQTNVPAVKSVPQVAPTINPATSAIAQSTTEWKQEDKENFLKCIEDIQGENRKMAHEEKAYAHIYTAVSLLVSLFAVIIGISLLQSSYAIKQPFPSLASVIYNPMCCISIVIIFIAVAATITILSHSSDIDDDYSLCCQRATALTVLRARIAVGSPSISKENALNEFDKIMAMTSY